MITPAYVRIQSAYNAEMNRRLYAAAGRLSDAERRQDRGAFFGSIHATLNHLLWADNQWMSRFDGWDKPPVVGRGGTEWFSDFAELEVARIKADSRISAWAEALDQSWLDQDQVWYSGIAKRDMSRPRGMLLVHFFNHQIHHRGQVHAMLTAAGEDTGDTDIWLILPEEQQAA